MQTVSSKWFLLGLAVILVGFFAFVFTTHDPTAQDVRFLAVNESDAAVTLTVWISGDEVFSQQVDEALENNIYHGRQTAAFSLETENMEFVLEAEAAEPGLSTRHLIDIRDGTYVTVTYWGDSLTVSQSREPF